MENSNLIGRFASSKSGHDKGMLYVIIAQDHKFAYLCDGKFHTLARPKKKSMKHITLYTDSLTEDLKERLINKERIFDHEIKYAIKIQQKGKEEEYVKE